jgi:Na+-driven multidrug efflux pump
MTRRLDLGKEAIFPLILKMSWPSIIAMTAMSVYNFIDTFWLARLSSQALATLTVCFPIQMIFAAIGVGTGIGAGSFSARMFGAGKIIQARLTAGKIFPLSFFFGLLMIAFASALILTAPIVTFYKYVFRVRQRNSGHVFTFLSRHYCLHSPFTYFTLLVWSLGRLACNAFSQT